MWAMTNRHRAIAKMLLDHGANPDIKSSSGGTAYDFVQPGSDFSHYLHENGYNIGAQALATISMTPDSRRIDLKKSSPKMR